MESAAAAQANGINLDNYFLAERSCNTAVYVHKRFINRYTEANKAKKEPEVVKIKTKASKIKKRYLSFWGIRTKKEDNLLKHDKCQQFDGNHLVKEEDPKSCFNDTVLEQAVQFTKNIIPLALPRRERSTSPVYYVVKASKRYKKDQKPKDSTYHEDRTYKKEKKVIETYRNEKRDSSQRESLSVKETVSLASNTLDEIHLNQSFCCSLSDISEKRHKRKRDESKSKQNEIPKLVASESFEALATELFTQSKIKIHLMDENTKNLFVESIKKPVLDAVREGITDIYNATLTNSQELSSITKVIKHHERKLDDVLERLAIIEKKIDTKEVGTVQKKVPSPRQSKSFKLSKLEQLEEDSTETDVKVENSTDEGDKSPRFSARKRAKAKSAVVKITPRGEELEEMKVVGCDEETEVHIPPVKLLGVRPERPNRLPARFCWTNARND